MFNLPQKKLRRLLMLVVYIILSCLFVYIFKPVYLLSILIVLLPPSLANFFWLKKSRGKILWFSLLTTLIFAPPVELTARLANAWDVQSILPRILGIAPTENLLFAFFNFFWVLCFYEYFSDGDTSAKISPRLRWLVLGYCLLAATIFSLFFINQELMALNYATLAVIILLVPGIIIFSLKPLLLKKIGLTTIFFALLFFMYEVVSMLIGSWWWPGNYLLPIKIFGLIFPLDDVIIWYLISTPVLIGGYEFFVDDGH
ncbi:MAG: hypothetical protein NT165_01095 [Candidatus Falkowbacteria bacterium]|nr:hypothetical protein [Candidatus Falkowbacteria bacterium]